MFFLLLLFWARKKNCPRILFLLFLIKRASLKFPWVSKSSSLVRSRRRFHALRFCLSGRKMYKWNRKALTAKCQNIGLATSNQTISFRVALNISLSWQLALFPVFSPFFCNKLHKRNCRVFSNIWERRRRARNQSLWRVSREIGPTGARVSSIYRPFQPLSSRDSLSLSLSLSVALGGANASPAFSVCTDQTLIYIRNDFTQ